MWHSQVSPAASTGPRLWRVATVSVRGNARRAVVPRSRSRYHAAVRRLYLAAPLLTVVLAGCGVRFSDPEPGTEFFASLVVTGSRVASEPMTAVVSYTQNYPIEVELVCELRQNKTTLFEIGKAVVPPLPNGNPDATPFVGSLSYDFVPPAAGTYKIECLTPKDVDNFIDEKITVSAAQ